MSISRPIKTVVTGVLRVASAIPDPPFELIRDGVPVGFDIALMQAICADLGLAWQGCRYEGADFNGIFDGLADGSWDCVASGATITPARRSQSRLLPAPISFPARAFVCNVTRTPNIRSIHDLKEQIIAVQHGNTSQPVAERLKAQGEVADVRVYPYDGIGKMLDDLESRADRRHHETGAGDALADPRPPQPQGRAGRHNDRKAGDFGADRGTRPLREALDAAQARLAANGRWNGSVGAWIGP